MIEYIVKEQQSISLIVLLILSLVLPACAARREARLAAKWIWAGELLIALVGIDMLFAPRLSFIALSVGFLMCGAVSVRILRIEPKDSNVSARGPVSW